jgi:hypothetical protein
MTELFFFILGLANSVLLTLVFLIRRRRLDLLLRFGWLYLILSAPAAYGVYLTIREHQSYRYVIFLTIFLVFLAFEGLLDHVAKIDFRENWKKNWPILTPYLALYYAMNYGFIVMPWQSSQIWGLIMLGLFVIQLLANLGSHARIK